MRAVEVRGSGPGNPVASPRSHGVPRRDVLAAFTSALQAKPQAVQTKRAWLSRDSASTCPHAEHRWLVNAGLIFSTRPGALSSSRRTRSPNPTVRISRLSPDLAWTFLPGFPAVPLAERVMFLIWRSSTLIRSNRRTMPVLGFSAQSCACPSRGPSTGRRRASPVLDGWSPAWRGRAFVPGVVASSAPAWPGRERAAIHPSTGRRTPRPLCLCLPPRWYRALRWPRELRRTRHASARRGQRSPDKTSCRPVSRGTSGTAPTRPSEPRLHRSSG